MFRGIGKLSGDNRSFVSDISRDGSVVVGGSYLSGGDGHAVRFVSGALLSIAEPASVPSSNSCSARGIDASGTVVVNCGGVPFLYSLANGAVAVDLSAIGGGSVFDVSLDGKVLVGQSSSWEAFRKVGSSITQPGGLIPGGSSTPYATNGDGSVWVGEADVGGGRGAVRWTANVGLVPLPTLAPTPNDVSESAKDVSTDGKVIVGSAHLSVPSSANYAVKWSGAPLSLTVLGPGQANCTNGSGSVIAGLDVNANATIWDSAGVARTVKALLGATPDLTGWTLTEVRGISDDGKFVAGNGVHDGQDEGWVAHLP